jgi:hypothetical protein
MISKKEPPELSESNNKKNYTPIISSNGKNNFLIEDWKKSGIPEETINKYLEKNYLVSTDDGWKLIYPELYEDKHSSYNAKRIKNPKDGRKYIRPSGETSRIFRPIDLPPEYLFNSDNYLILCEGEKKSISAVAHGFNCLSVAGVWNWKKSIDKELETMTIEQQLAYFKKHNEDEEKDIIPDILNMNWSNRTVYICYDNDLVEKDGVKNALYSLSCYLIGMHKAKVKIIYLPEGEAKGLDDYLLTFGKDAFQTLMSEAKELTLKEIQDILMGNISQKIKFPIDIFTNDLKENVIDLAKRMDAPIEYIACSILVGASILMDGYYNIDVLNDGSWIDNPILWMAIVGGASQKKTPCLTIPKKIINDFELKLMQKYESENEVYKQKKAEYKTKVKQYEKEKPKNPNVIAPIMPKEPIRQKITSQNATVEAIAKSIYNNKNRGIGIFVDELASFLKGLGQYKKGYGNDEEYFLQAWKKQAYQYDRVNGADYFIYPSHNIIGSIQPKVLEKTLFKDGFETSNGMIERWLFVCTDYEETGEIYTSDRPYSVDIIKDIYKRLYENKIEKTFCFSDDAQNIYNKFNKSITKSKKNTNMTDLTKNYIQKQTDYVARFSLILHCMFDFDNNTISSSTVQSAIKLSVYFINCFEKISNISMNASSNSLAMRTLDWLRIKSIKQISPSKLYKTNTSKYKSPPLARITLEILSGFGFGRLEKCQNGGVKFNLYT